MWTQTAQDIQVNTEQSVTELVWRVVDIPTLASIQTRHRATLINAANEVDCTVLTNAINAS